MLGTAEYHVGFSSAAHAKNLSALKPGVQQTEAPAAADARTTATRPWIWNRGMMLRQRSDGLRLSVATIFRADANRFACDRGTTLGLDVVPDVWSTKASRPSEGAIQSASSGQSVNSPARSLSPLRSSATSIPRRAADALTGLSESLSTNTSLGL